MAYDEEAIAKKANEIQTAIRDTLLNNSKVSALVGTSVFMDDISETIGKDEDPEAGSLIRHGDFPAIKIYYTGTVQGQVQARGFTDLGFKFIVRALSEEPTTNKGKQEVRRITELARLVLANNYNLSGTCYDSDFMNWSKETETKYGASVDRDNAKDKTVAFEKLGDIIGIARELIPMNYV